LLCFLSLFYIFEGTSIVLSFKIIYAIANTVIEWSIQTKRDMEAVGISGQAVT